MARIYAPKTLRELKHTVNWGVTYKGVWQSRMSVGAIDEVLAGGGKRRGVRVRAGVRTARFPDSAE